MRGESSGFVSKNIADYRSRFIGRSTPRNAVNTRSVTVRQIQTACASRKHEGRFVLNNSLLYAVTLCGRIIYLEQAETHTEFKIYDGTGVLDGRIWPTNSNGTTDFSGATIDAYYTIVCNVLKDNDQILLQAITARKVENHNMITMHMLAAIHEDCMLGYLQCEDLEKWDKAKAEADKVMRTTLGLELDKESIVSLLSEPKIRESDSGASSTFKLDQLHLGQSEGWTALQSMLDEGSVYNTTDYCHFKLADER